MTHPYFTAKARRIFTNARGNPDNAGPLASWAESARRESADPDRGVLVAEDGTIVAHTRYVRARVSAHYVTACPLDTTQVNREVGLATSSMARELGQAIIHVTFSQAATGASRSSDPRT